MPDKPARRWPKRVLLAAAVFVALVAAGNVVVLVSTGGRTVAGPEAAPARTFVIVLGNLVSPQGPGRELRERLETAYATYRAGRASRVLVSGRAREGYDEPAVMAEWLQVRGVPSAHIVLDRGGHRTAATMADASALGIRTALISTQAYHLPRALYLAGRAGIDAIGVPAPRGHRSVGWIIHNQIREMVARAEIVVEVALFGVRA